MQFNYQYWMRKTIEHSALSTQHSVFSEVPIASLIVRDNEIIAAATNKIEQCHDATSHAEILAIQKASKVFRDWRLKDCALYTTLEPCPMCTGAIINSRISKLVFGAYDLNQGACGSKINLFKLLEKENQTEVIGGILELECSKLLKEFFVLKR